jgi:predicted Zn-dependent protease
VGTLGQAQRGILLIKPELTRRQKIEAMLVDEPHDVFLRYSLALEMVNEQQCEPAIVLLQQLCVGTPPYVPAYFRCAQIMADMNKVAEARNFLREGIEAARMQGDLHAAAEMSEMLSELGQHP